MGQEHSIAKRPRETKGSLRVYQEFLGTVAKIFELKVSGRCEV